MSHNTRLVAALGLLLVGFTQAQESDRWDVVVLGGGSTGTFSAIRLRQQGLSVALIEKQDQLGGHVDTYVDPASNATWDYGVQLFTNTSIVTDYFSHFDVPLVSVDLASGMSSRLNIDFKSGLLLNSSYLLSGNLTLAAQGLFGYLSETAKYPSIFEEWNITRPISEDLLMPFGDFLQSKGLEGAAFSAFSFAAGCGNILKQTTLYVMKYFTPLQVNAVITQGFLANGLSNNQELYDRARAELAEAAFLSSDVYYIQRDSSGVEVHMYTPSGPRRIKARKLLITIPPKLENLSPFMNLDENETELFSQFNNTYYWNMMLKNTGLPANASINNIDHEAPLMIPAMPAIYTLNAVPTIPGLHSAYLGSATPMTEGQVKEAVTESLSRIRAGLELPDPAESLEFLGFNSHAPFVLTVPTDAIRAGFYENLVALQGEKDTWYTGAAWLSQASGELWEYAEAKVLPGLVASLGLRGLVPLGGGNATNTTGSDASVGKAADTARYEAPAGYVDLKKAVDVIRGYKRWF